jgi:hypothetical protein
MANDSGGDGSEKVKGECSLSSSCISALVPHAFGDGGGVPPPLLMASGSQCVVVVAQSLGGGYIGRRTGNPRWWCRWSWEGDGGKGNPYDGGRRCGDVLMWTEDGGRDDGGDCSRGEVRGQGRKRGERAAAAAADA